MNVNEESDRLKALRNDLAVCERMLAVVSDQHDHQNLLDQADLLRADIKRLAEWEQDFSAPSGGV